MSGDEVTMTNAQEPDSTEPSKTQEAGHVGQGTSEHMTQSEAQSTVKTDNGAPIGDSKIEAKRPATVPAPAAAKTQAAKTVSKLLPKSRASLSEPDPLSYNPANVKKTERIEKAEGRLQTNPYDTDAWMAILGDVQSANIDTFRCYYEKFLKLFPFAGHYWKTYIDREIKQRNYGRVELLFKKNLLNCLSLDLWRGYLSYVKDTKQDQPNYREVLRKTYDFVLEHVGMDINSTPIWQEYLNFVKSTTSSNTYEEGQKMTAMRQIYQRAVSNPMVNIEQLWKDYDAYENSLNKLTAKKLLQDLSAAYMTARSVYRERKTRSEGIIWNLLAAPPRGTAKEKQQLKIWRDYIEWEKTNPLRLESPAQVERRVVFAYKQALLSLTHQQAIWFDFCQYLVDQGKKEQAAVQYEKAITALPNNMLLHFCYANHLESCKSLNKAAQIYERLLANPGIEDLTLVYVQYMKFRKRMAGFQGARAVFKRARADARCGYQVYVASALIEYYSSKAPDTAVKIFELGMRSYQNNGNYVMAYLDFLSSLTEAHNTRVLFERVVNSIKPEDSAPIWKRFLHFEADHGELESALKVASRVQGSLSWPSIMQAIEGHTYMDLKPCSKPELELCNHVKASIEGDAQHPAATIDSNAKEINQQYPMPDPSQWVSFNPEDDQAAGSVPVIFAELLRQLPPPSFFSGPYANVDMLMELLGRSPNIPALPDACGALAARPENLPASTNNTRPGSDKRTTDAAEAVGENDPEVGTHVGGCDPYRDIFRKRQRQQLTQ